MDAKGVADPQEGHQGGLSLRGVWKKVTVADVQAKRARGIGLNGDVVVVDLVCDDRPMKRQRCLEIDRRSDGKRVGSNRDGIRPRIGIPLRISACR